MDQMHADDALAGAWRLVSWENQAAYGLVTHSMWSCRCSQLGRQRSGAVDRACQGPADLSASPLLPAGKPQVPRLVWEQVDPPPIRD